MDDTADSTRKMVVLTKESRFFVPENGSPIPTRSVSKTGSPLKDRDGSFRSVDRDGSFRSVDRDGSFRSLDRDGSFRNLDRDGSFRNLDRDGSFRNLDRDGSFRNLDRDGSFRSLEKSFLEEPDDGHCDREDEGLDKKSSFWSYQAFCLFGICVILLVLLCLLLVYGRRDSSSPFLHSTVVAALAGTLGYAIAHAQTRLH